MLMSALFHSDCSEGFLTIVSPDASVGVVAKSWGVHGRASKAHMGDSDHEGTVDSVILICGEGGHFWFGIYLCSFFEDNCLVLKSLNEFDYENDEADC